MVFDTAARSPARQADGAQRLAAAPLLYFAPLTSSVAAFVASHTTLHSGLTKPVRAVWCAMCERSEVAVVMSVADVTCRWFIFVFTGKLPLRLPPLLTTHHYHHHRRCRPTCTC